MKTIGIIHATHGAVEPLMQAFREEAPQFRPLNFVNEQLSAYAKSHGTDEYIVRQFLRTAFEALDAGVDALVIGCSIFCRYADVLSELTAVPVLAVDDPMMQEAAKHGKKIGLLATNDTTVPTSTKQLEAYAARYGRTVEVIGRNVPGAGAAFAAGDLATFDALLKAAGKDMADAGCDTLVLCQITMSRAAAQMTDLPLNVYTSPQEAVRRLLAIAKGGAR